MNGIRGPVKFGTLAKSQSLAFVNCPLSPLATCKRLLTMSATNAARPDGRRAGSTGSEPEKAEMSETPKQMFNVEAPENEDNVEMDEQEKNRILRKIDWAIVVCLRGDRQGMQVLTDSPAAIQRPPLSPLFSGPCQYW